MVRRRETFSRSNIRAGWEKNAESNHHRSGSVRMIFANRIDAGRRIAEALLSYKGQDIVVYALPRGGVVVAAQIAEILDAPLDLVIVRKVGHPYAPEYAIAAVAEDGHIVENRSEVDSIDRRAFEESVRIEQQEARRRRDLYMRGRTPI